MAGNILREIVTRFSVRADPAQLNQFNGAVEGAKQKLGELSVMLAGIGVSTALVTQGFSTLAREGAEIQQISTAFKELGGSAEELAKMKEITGGLVSDTDLQRAANLGKLFKLPAEQIPHLLKIAQGSSVALGTSVAKNIDDVFTAMARNSGMIADNLGTQMGPLDLINKEYAQRNKLQVANLTNEQKTAAFTEAFVAKSQRQLALSEKAADNVLALGDAATKNLRTQAALIANTIAGKLLRQTIPLIEKVTAAVEGWWNAGRKTADATNKLTGKFNALGITTMKFRRILTPAEVAVNRVVGAIKLLGSALAAVTVTKTIMFFKTLITMTGAWVKSLILGVRALGLIRASLLFIPIVLATIGLLVQDILVWSRGGKSAIGAFVDKFAEGPGILGKLARLIRDNKTQIVAFAQSAADLFFRLIEYAKELAPQILSGARKVGGFVAGLVSGIGSKSSGFWSAFTGFINKVTNALGKVAPYIADLVGEIVQLVVEIAEGDLVGPLLDVVVAIVEAVWRIAQALIPLVKNLVLTVVRIVKTLAPAIGRLIQAIVKVVKALVPVIEKALASAINIIDIALPIIEGIIDTVIALVEKALPIVTAIISKGADLVIWVLEKVVPAVSWMAQKIISVITWVVEGAIGNITWISEKIGWLVEGAAKLFAWLLDNVFTPFFTKLSGAITWITNLWDRMGEGMRAAFDTVMEWLQPIIDTIMQAVDAAKWLAGNNDVYQSEQTKKDLEEALALGGGGGIGALYQGIAEQQKQKLLAAQNNTNNQTTIGSQTIQVQAPTTPMGPTQIAAAAKQGTEEGIRKATARDLSVGGDD